MKADLTAIYAQAEEAGIESADGVILQADVIETVRRYAKLDDINQMLAGARSGLSSQLYTSPECPARYHFDGSVIVDIGFTAWPNPLSLAYTLAASMGQLSPAERVAVEKSFDVVVAFATRSTLPAIMDPLIITWQTHCYNKFGDQVAAPEITVDGRDLVFSTSVFGVLRVNGLTHGDHYTLALTIALAQATGPDPVIDPAGFRFDAKTASTVTASWVDSAGISGHAIIELAAPPCVNDMLDTCADGAPTGQPGTVITAENESTPVVYYSDCTGHMIELRYE